MGLGFITLGPFHVMEIEKVIQWVVVNKLLRCGYNPTHVKLEVIANMANDLMHKFDEDQIMKEYRKWLH
jgi:hypothetical protein